LLALVDLGVTWNQHPAFYRFLTTSTQHPVDEREAMSANTGPTLDDEGIPDLQGPLPEKEETGDPQEGLMPPQDHPVAATDWGITGDEQRAGEPLDRRVAHERPDIGETDPVDDILQDEAAAERAREDDDPADVIGRDGEREALDGELVGDDVLRDEEDEVVAAIAETDLEGRSAEEDAIHVVDDDA
jgi:hypothetical protein